LVSDENIEPFLFSRCGEVKLDHLETSSSELDKVSILMALREVKSTFILSSFRVKANIYILANSI
jgi:hypothetical protein